MKSLLPLILILVFASTPLAAEIKESDVKSLLDSWLIAQNTGSFASYSSLYAAKFQGIKRSGERSSRFNHDTWLKDRKRMFRKKMAVSAGNVNIRILETGAIVEFKQTWESNGYKDRGDKQLFLVLENGQLRIMREEMLVSKVLAGKGMVLDSTNFPFAFAMDEGIVLPGKVDAIKVDLNKLKLEINGSDHMAWGPVDAALLPASFQTLIGMPVRLYGPKGSCESKISGFKVVSKKIPHIGEIMRWKEEKTPRKKIVLNIYNEGARNLIATTENVLVILQRTPDYPHHQYFPPKNLVMK